jgi:hypothetical protein
MGFSTAAAATAATAAEAAGTTAAVAAPTILGLSVPTFAAISGGLSALTGLGGALLSSGAQSRAASAIAQQNSASLLAQNEAFNQRIAAGLAQTAAQRQASEQTLSDRAGAASLMRQSQIGAQQRQSDILAAENQQEAALRQAGDTQAQQLLDATNAQKLAQGQQNAAVAQSLLLDQSAPPGPAPTDPQGTTGDSVTSDAIARRLAQASSNVRTYGAKAANLQSYNQPVQDIGLAILANKYGIMPAQTAETLLRSGSNTRLLPAQVQFRNAGDLGSALDALLASKGQNQLDIAGLAYNNAVAQANLGQSDTTTIAKNTADQARQDAQFQQQVGGLVSGIGSLGLYGTGMAVGAPSFLGGTGSLSKIV